MVDESGRRVEHRLQTAYHVGWDANQYCIAVVESRVAYTRDTTLQASGTWVSALSVIFSTLYKYFVS